MSSPSGALSALIGARVRSARQERSWSLDHLAQESGVSRRLVVDVEQGRANPSVGTLLRLAEALDVSLSSLVDAPSEPEALRVWRAGTGALLWSGLDGGEGVLLASTAAPDVLELWDWTLAPGETHASAAHTPGTRECLHVLEGTLGLTVDGATHVLSAGDSAAFVGDVPHAYRAEGGGACRFSLAVSEAAAGGRRSMAPPHPHQ